MNDEHTPIPPAPDAPKPDRTGRPTMPPVVGLLIAAGLLVAAGVVFINKRTLPPAKKLVMGDRQTMPNSEQIESIDEEFDLDGLIIDRDQIFSPSPNRDDIPSLTTADARGPDYQLPDHIHWENNRPPTITKASDDEMVPGDSDIVGVTVNGESRAYPHTLLDRHECINDVLGGVPIAVTYCPLCDSATIFDRRMGQGDDEVTLEFGISGLLYNSNVLLYDRTHHALWSQVLLTAVSGPFAGQPLRYLDGWEITTLGQWEQRHPDTTVLTYDTGLQHYPAGLYDERGYPGYFDRPGLMFPVSQTDDRLPLKTPVIGIVHGDTTRAYLVSAIDGTWSDTLGDNATLTLRGDGQGSVEVVDMPEGTQVTHTFWYAWYAFHPETELVAEMPAE